MSNSEDCDSKCSNRCDNDKNTSCDKLSKKPNKQNNFRTINTLDNNTRVINPKKEEHKETNDDFNNFLVHKIIKLENQENMIKSKKLDAKNRLKPNKKQKISNKNYLKVIIKPTSKFKKLNIKSPANYNTNISKLDSTKISTKKSQNDIKDSSNKKRFKNIGSNTYKPDEQYPSSSTYSTIKLNDLAIWILFCQLSSAWTDSMKVQCGQYKRANVSIPDEIKGNFKFDLNQNAYAAPIDIKNQRRIDDNRTRNDFHKVIREIDN